MSSPSFGNGRALSGALRLLEEVARCGAGVTAQELSANLGMPQATAYRILNSLVQEEYLERLPSLSGFALGHKVVELATQVPAAFRLTQAAKGELDAARSEFRGGLHLIGYEEARIRILDPDPDVAVRDEEVIVRRPTSTAVGRLMLASLASRSPGHAEAAGGRELDPSVLTFTRSRGFATQIDELVPGFGCLAVPVVDAAAVTVGCLCLSTSTDRLRDPALVAERLRAHARALAPLIS